MIISLVLVSLIALIGYNALPIFIRVLPWLAEYTFLTDFILVNPLVAFTAGLIFGISNGFIFLVAILIGALFIPTAFIVYNSSALIYVVGYMIFALIGLWIGSVIHNRRKQKSNIEQSIRRRGYYN